MFKSYFFIPANNKRFIQKGLSLKADHFVFDLEDAIIEHELKDCLKNLSELNIKDNFYIRPNLFPENPDKINSELIQQLITIGFKNFLIPKFLDKKQIERIQSEFEKSAIYEFEKYSFILLVEHPLGLLNLHETITSRLLNFKACGFGSHDYCNSISMKHHLENLSFVRHSILNIAKANNIEALDIVSTDLNNEHSFCEEAYNGFSLGFDGKFLIHPRQLELLSEIQFYTKEEIAEAQSVYEKVLEIKNKQISVIKINGKVYEKPHINRIINIIKWSKQYGSK